MRGVTTRALVLVITLGLGTAAAEMPATGTDGPRFRDNGDGTITDTRTSLVWEKLSDDDSIHDKDKKYPWPETIAKIRALNGASFAGHNDWRLPTVDELAAIAKRGQRPAIDAIFDTNCVAKCTVLTCSCNMPSLYWSSTTYKADSAIAGALDFRNGFVDSPDRPNNNFVRAVRGGTAAASR